MKTYDDHIIDGNVEVTKQFKSTTTLLAPLAVASSILVSGFNADLLDGQHGSYYLNRSNHTGSQLLATISDADDLKAIETLSGTGFLKRTGVNAWALDSTVATYSGLTNTYIPKWNGSALVNSLISESGSVVTTAGQNRTVHGTNQQVLIGQNVTSLLPSFTSASSYGGSIAFSRDADGAYANNIFTFTSGGGDTLSKFGFYSRYGYEFATNGGANIRFSNLGQLQIAIATGTAPLSISSTTLVSNLNADLLDGQHGSYYQSRTNHTGSQLLSTISDADDLKAIEVLSGTGFLKRTGANTWALDGSVVTMGSLTSGVVPYWNGSALADSQISTDGTTMRVKVPYAKTDLTGRVVAQFSSNESSAFNSLGFAIFGGATQADRIASIGTSENGISFGGTLSLQPNAGKVTIGGGSNLGTETFNIWGNTNITSGVIKFAGSSGTSGQFLKTTGTANNWATLTSADISDLSASILSQALTGYTVGSNAALASSDSILGAFGKVQGQINSLSTSSHAALTIGTANGLSLTGQAISLGLAGSGSTGALSSTNWNTFNNKIGGSGTADYYAIYTSSGSVGNGLIHNTSSTNLSFDSVYASFGQSGSYKMGIYSDAGSGAILFNSVSSELYRINYNSSEWRVSHDGGTTATIKIDRATGNVTFANALAGYVQTSRSLTINGTAYDLSANRSWSVGTVTQVGLTVPTGFTVTSFPVTGSGNNSFAFDTGYSLPTNASQSNWNTAYSWGNHASAGYVPQSRQITINGTTYDLSANRSWTISTGGSGTVTSVGLTVPTGFTVTSFPVTSSGNNSFDFASGYSLPTNASQNNWNSAWNRVSNGGTTNRLPKWNGGSYSDSEIYDNGSTIGGNNRTYNWDSGSTSNTSRFNHNLNVHGNLICGLSGNGSQMGVHESGAGSHSSAILYADSSTRGFLPPRMTNGERNAISSPEVGLLVIQTDGAAGLYIYKSGGWTYYG